MGSDAVSITDLGVPADLKADVTVDLDVRQETFTLESGREVDGYTVNGQSPGPTIRATQGDLVEVNLVNESVPDGVTLHWHGIDVPNPMDGVAGVTQDEVPEGGLLHLPVLSPTRSGRTGITPTRSLTSRCIGGLLGAVIVSPADKRAADANVVDVPALVHIYDGLAHCQRCRR